MAAIEDDQDLLENDPFLSEEAFLAAVAEVESQHLGRLTSVLSYDCSRISPGCYGDEIVDPSTGVKRSARWEEKSIDELRSCQPLRCAVDCLADHSVDDARKRVCVEADRRTSWTHNAYAGQVNDSRSSFDKPSDNQPEGDYMAALRGSNSELWQSSAGDKGVISNFANKVWPSVSPEVRNLSGTGPCFKCGIEGHWAKDCTGGKAAEVHTTPDVPERICACGAGACIVLTAQTEKNQGRRFYRCPLRKDDGQCTFFEWCDAGGKSAPAERANWPPLECKCGAGPCATLTAKTEKNLGRQFYKCPSPQGCSFFQWCDEVGRDTPGNNSRTPVGASNHPMNGVSSSPVIGNCFKCGQEGHWSRDCPNQQQQYGGSSGSQSQSSNGNGTPECCYKCGQEGHWSRHCTNQLQQNGGSFGSHSQSSNGNGLLEGSNINCYKCGGQGHWSNSCPNAGATLGKTYAKQGAGTSAPGGACFKCGDQGHWANRCPTVHGGQQ